MCEWGTSRAVTISQTVLVDACLADEVVWMNGRGIRTKSSCCGHGKADQEPNIVINPADQQLARSLGYEPEYVDPEDVEQGVAVMTVRPVRSRTLANAQKLIGAVADALEKHLPSDIQPYSLRLAESALEAITPKVAEHLGGRE